MLFNRDELELLNFGKNTRTFHCERSQGKQLEGKVSAKDLGIKFEPNEKFNKYITSVVAKGNCMVGWILRTFRTCTKEIMLTLLKLLSVPQVEYGCII